MNRNEYRRAFIMLRAAKPGYGGHIRLERRTLTGSMYFIVSAPQGAGTLRAALVGQRSGDWYAAPLGALSRDRRGQLTLAVQFDPRSVGGRPLEAYAWVAIADAGDRWAVVLTGNVEGSRAVDPPALERAVRDCFAGDEEPAAALPESREPNRQASAPDPGSASRPEGDSALSQADPDGEEACDIKIYTGSRARAFAAPTADRTPQAAPGAGGEARVSRAREAADGAEARGERAVLRDLSPGTASGTDPGAEASLPELRADAAVSQPTSEDASAAGTPSAVPQRISESPSDPAVPQRSSEDASAAGTRAAIPQQISEDASAAGAPAAISQQASADPPAADPARSRAFPEARTAAQRLGLDITRPWSALLEPLRRLFATQAPLQDGPDDEYVYIRAPMPAASGYDACLVGLTASGGRALRLRYALPARYTPLPPAGLEAYRWLGDGGEGYWVLDIPAE